MHACTHACTHSCTHSHTHIHTHTRTHTHTHTHMHTHTFMHVHACTRTHMHTHTYTHACMYSHTHTLTRAPMHTHTTSLQIKSEGGGSSSYRWCKGRGLEQQRFYEMAKLRQQFQEILQVLELHPNLQLRLSVPNFISQSGFSKAVGPNPEETAWVWG